MFRRILLIVALALIALPFCADVPSAQPSKGCPRGMSQDAAGRCVPSGSLKKDTQKPCPGGATRMGNGECGCQRGMLQDAAGRCR